MTLSRLRAILSPTDVVTLGFLSFLSALNLIFAARVEPWLALVAINTATSGVIVALAYLAETRRTGFLIGLHRWYCYPIIILVFKELYLMVRPIHPIDYDQLFIAVDYWVFGFHPTQWMARLAHPVLTEILQTAYFSYYLIFIILGVEIYRRFPIEHFDHAAFMIVYGFYLSYLGYFLLPAIGPRFTLHDFHSLSTELPGIVLTEPFRAFINAGESIPHNVPNPQDFVQRDVFPSGHTQLTLIVLYLAYRNRLKTRWIITGIAVLLIIGTVYLRYHYVVDLAGGALVAWLSVWSGNRIESWWSKRTLPEARPG